MKRRRRKPKRRLPEYLALYAAYVAFVNLVPGPWSVRKPRGAVDGWTVTHVLAGVVGRKMGLSFGEMVALGALNEVGEGIIRKYRPDLLWGEPEPVSNVMVDLGANAIGWILG